MSFFSKLFGDGGGGREGKWDGLDGPARVKQLVLPLLESVATAARATSASAHSVGREDAELTGALDGFPFVVKVSWSGTIELELRYDDELSFVDITNDPDSESTTSQGDRLYLAPGVYVESKRAATERDVFLALPAELRARALGAIRTHRASYVRSRPDHMSIHLRDAIYKPGDQVARIVTMLGIARDLSAARGARPSPMAGAPLDPERPFAGWPHLDKDERWKRATMYADAVAKRTGGRVLAREKERQVEVRWVEGDRALGAEVDLSFGGVSAMALAKGVKGEFTLWRDPEMKLEETHVGDAWDDDGYVFFGKCVFVSQREEAVPLSALPTELLQELTGAMEKYSLDMLLLEDEALSARVAKFHRAGDPSEVIDVARLLGRVSAALQRGPTTAPVHDRVVRCKFCRAMWFPTANRQTCTQCGAPG